MAAPQPFCGAKIVLFHGEELLTYRRDDRPDIPHPNCWDLPGGGREGDETPEQCALRELREEFGIRLPQRQILWGSRHIEPALQGPGRRVTFFFAGIIRPGQIAAIRFGDEGQYWRMRAVEAFIADPEAVPALARRVETCWQLVRTVVG